MTKRCFALILSLVMVLLCFSLNVSALTEMKAHTKSVDVEYQYLSRMPYMEIVKFMPKNKAVTIPESFEGRPIGEFEADVSTSAPLTHIYVSDDNMFFTDIDGIVYDRSLTALVRVPHHRAGKIVVREGVEVISNGAFNGCKNVTEIVLPKSLKSIGYWAFKDCSSLKKLVIPQSVEAVGFDCFVGCSSLTELQINNPYLPIEKDAFIDTAFYKKSSNWENGALYSGNVLLATNENLPVAYTVKEGTVAIASYAFSQNKNLESVHLPDSIKAIGDGAFYKCVMLSDVRMPEVGCYIGSGVFSETYISRSTKQSLYVGKHLIHMYKGYAKIKEGTLSVAKYAIPSNASVGTLEIPASLTTLSMPIMTYDASLAGVQVDPANQHFVVQNGVLYDKTMKKLILCPTTVTKLDVPQTVETIGCYAFYECRKLTELNLPASLKKIESNAFDTCIRLPKLVIPDSVTYVADNATTDCCDLQNIKIGKGLKRATLCTFASEREGYVDVPYEAEYIATNHMWRGTTLLVASNSFALEFAKAYNIPYKINKEGPKPVAPKPESVPEKPLLQSDEGWKQTESTQQQPPVQQPIVTVGATTVTPTETATATDTGIDGGSWIWFAVGVVVLLGVGGAGWWLYYKKKGIKHQ